MTPLDRAVAVAYGEAATVVSCTPSIYATSHPLTDVVVDLGDGRTVALVQKDIATLLPGAEATRPTFLRDPGREGRVYRRLLAQVDVGAPRLVAEGEGWLLLEKVTGVELYQVGDVEVWRAVAERVADMHRAFTTWSDAGDGVQALGLLHHDAGTVDEWPARAAAALAASAQASWSRALRDRYGEVRDRILSLPQTILHGELYASNVLVSDLAAPVRRVCPIDWEMAATGAGLLDLAALVAGAWPEEDRAAIAGSYLRAFPALGREDLDVCRLHLAVQWLGWSPGWVAPPAHAHAWLAEAQDLSLRLGVV